MTGRIVRVMLATAFWVLAAGSPGPACAQFATPEDAVRAVYELYRSKDGPGFPSDPAGIGRFLEPVLARAWIRDSAGASQGKNFLDADPFIQGQDWDIAGLSIKPAQVMGDRATVRVSFRNFNAPVSVTYHLARRAEGWRIYDVIGRGAGVCGHDLGLRG